MDLYYYNFRGFEIYHYYSSICRHVIVILQKFNICHYLPIQCILLFFLDQIVPVFFLPPWFISLPDPIEPSGSSSQVRVAKAVEGVVLKSRGRCSAGSVQWHQQPKQLWAVWPDTRCPITGNGQRKTAMDK